MALYKHKYRIESHWHPYWDYSLSGAYVVMPNHVHMIVDILDGGDGGHNPDHQPMMDEIKQYRKQRRKMTIPKIVGKFKILTSKHINIAQNRPSHKNWQANYHDHIIRNDASYQRIKAYITNNPLNWDNDKFYG